MTKTSKPITRLIISAALAMLLSLSLALPVFASAPKYTTGTGADDPADAVITKVFQVSNGTVIPESDFVFEFTAVGIDEGTDSSKMKKLPDVTISFDRDEEPADGTFINGDTKSVVRESAYILAGVDESWWVNGEGVYKYKISEKQSGIKLAGNAKYEEDVYSGAVYDLEIWVEKDDGVAIPANKGKLFVKYINVKITEYIDDYYIGEDGDPTVEEGDKVDPTPGGSDEDKTVITIEDDFSQLIFTNSYELSNGGDGKDPEVSALEILKVTGGNGAVKSTLFPFDVTVKTPSIVKGSYSYIAYVMEGSENKTSAENGPLAGPDPDNGNYILFPSGSKVTVNLKDGQRLVFVDLHVGADVKVVEQANDDYQPRFERSFPVATGVLIGEAKAPWGFPEYANNDDKAVYTIEGNNKNIATFTNIRTGATPTGLDVNDLPFFVLIGAALAGLAGFVAVKSRRKADARS